MGGLNFALAGLQWGARPLLPQPWVVSEKARPFIFSASKEPPTTPRGQWGPPGMLDFQPHQIVKIPPTRVVSKKPSESQDFHCCPVVVRSLPLSHGVDGAVMRHPCASQAGRHPWKSIWKPQFPPHPAVIKSSSLSMEAENGTWTSTLPW